VNGTIKDIKITLNDGSRIVGTQGFKKGEIDSSGNLLI